MDNLDFIQDVDLHRTLTDSIEFIYTIYEQSKNKGQKELYVEETYRVMILYVVSAIEAVFLYIYKARGEKIHYLDYKYIQTLPKEFKYKDKTSSPIVVAVQEKVDRQEYQIGTHDLVNFFKDKKIIKETTATEILELNDTRNTLHFSKPRIKKCDLTQVESALKMLVYVIDRTPKALQNK